MDIPGILHTFANDKQLKAVAVLIVADLLFGVLASVIAKDQHFSLAYIANFMRNDVLSKVVPWFALFALGKTSSATVLGIDFGTLADGAWVGVSAALLGSLATSLGDLGVPLPSPLQRK